jgi:hypothetical protein
VGFRCAFLLSQCVYQICARFVTDLNQIYQNESKGIETDILVTYCITYRYFDRILCV